MSFVVSQTFLHCDGVDQGNTLVKPNHCASWQINFMQVLLLTTSGFPMPLTFSLLFEAQNL